MKVKSTLLVSLALAAAHAFATEKIAAGPKGGRLLETTPHRAELVVTPDRHVAITFYDASLKPVAPGAQVVSLTAEPGTGRTAIELEKTATGFVSAAPLPPGDPYRLVLQVRENAKARPRNFRIDLDLERCGECRLAEYACTCGH